MATTRTPKKATTNSATEKVEKEIVTAEVNTEVSAKESTGEAKKDVVNKEETKTIREKAKTYSPTDLILCKCVKPHEVIYVASRTGNYYEFSGYADEQEIEFQDLKALLTRKSGFLFDPSFIVMDGELLEQPMWHNLIPVYERLIDADTLEEMFDLSDEDFRAKLLIAPEGTKEAILSTAVNMIKNNTFRDLRKLRMIDEIFGSHLKEFID